MPGMSLRRAEKLCPNATFLPAREPLYRIAHDQLLALLAQYTERIEVAGPGFLFAQVSGLESLFGPDEQLVTMVAAKAAQVSKLQVSAGLATGKFVAQQAANVIQPGAGLVIPPGRETKFLAPLPLNTLPATPEMLRRLELLGIDTLGSLAALPRESLVDQFGAFAGPLHDLACGKDKRPVVSQAPPLVIEKRREFQEPLVTRPPVTAHVTQMAAEIGAELAGRGYQAEGLLVKVETPNAADARSSGRAVKPPSADANRLGRQANHLLDDLLLNDRVVAITLQSYPVRPDYMGIVQLSLFESAAIQRQQRLDEVLRLLRQRFGEQIVMVASLLGPPLPKPIKVTLNADRTPATLEWGGKTRSVSQVYEVWRERRSWWGLPVDRDYYRIETSRGASHVVFRQIGTNQWMLDRRHL